MLVWGQQEFWRKQFCRFFVTGSDTFCCLLYCTPLRAPSASQWHPAITLRCHSNTVSITWRREKLEKAMAQLPPTPDVLLLKGAYEEMDAAAKRLWERLGA
jgi:hypothetical protein